MAHLPSILMVAFLFHAWASLGFGFRVEVFRDSALDYSVHSFSTDGLYIHMFIVTRDGVIVVEPMSPDRARQLLLAIRSVTPKPIKYCLYSHNHWDHAAGGQVFRDEGAVIMAHEEAVAFLSLPGHLGRGVILPDKSWSGSNYSLQLGGVSLELHFVGQNHGFGMTIFFLPQAKVLYVADLIAPNSVWFATAPDVNLEGAQRSLSYVLNLDWDKGVFSHTGFSDPTRLGSKEDVANQLQYGIDLREKVDEMLANGTNPFLIPVNLKLPKYENFSRYKEFLPLNVYKVLFVRVRGPVEYRPDWPRWTPPPATQAPPLVKVECGFPSSVDLHVKGSVVLLAVAMVTIVILSMH